MIARVNVLDKGFVELVNFMGNDYTIVESARVSVMGATKGDEQDKKLLKYLIDNKHTSPFEQVEFRFRIKCPLFVARQWHRHRTWSYNEVSRRYTEEDIEFYVPDSLRKQAKSDRQASTDDVITSVFDGYCDADGGDFEVPTVHDYLENCYNTAFSTYKDLLSIGVAREQARMVLPQSMYTMFYAKVDLHNLLNFISLRDSEHSQFEIREYAKAIRKIITPIVPWTMEYFEKRG